MNLRILSILSFAVAASPLMGAEFFVDPSGNDQSSGNRAQPFASFARAQQVARAERIAHPTEAVTVTFQAGTYNLDKAVEFTPADSGASADNPVCYRANLGAEVVISGGRPITGWQADPQRPGIWKTRVTEPTNSADLSWRFEQLWVDGRRAVRARTPNYGEFGILESVNEVSVPNQTPAMTHTFTVRSEDLATLKGLDPVALHDVQMVAFHNWDTTREWLTSATPSEGVLTGRGDKMQPWNPIKRECIYYLENYLEALDAPGEWFLARDGWLYYKPRPGEDLSKAQVIAPKAVQFLAFAGNIGNSEQWVQHLRFEGLKFRFAEYRIPPQGVPPGQSAMAITQSAIQLDGARDIQFRDCAVEHIGTTAFWFRQACRDCRVDHSRMFDLGVGGVRIGEERMAPEPERTSGIVIDNCIIQNGGRIAPHTTAVWIGNNADNVIRHCEVSDFFYTAISVGWRWGYAESGAKRNLIEYNHLHHLGYRILSDMAGVYTLGPSEGTIVRNNVIHDVYCTRYGGWGLYPDEGSTGILFENNLVYHVQDGCVHQHYGKENIFRNNILAFSEEGQIAATRAEDHLSFTLERNIVYWDQGQVLGHSGWDNGVKVLLRSNLYWRVEGRPFDFKGKSWEAWRAAGNDEGSVIADPLFVDPTNGDFHLRPGSPVGKIGFVPFEPGEAGVYGDARWKQLAKDIVFPKNYVVPKPLPIAIHDGFEPGVRMPLLSIATLSHEGHSELIAITDALAASGKHSLKIQGQPGLEHDWDPHFWWDPQYVEGPARLSFKIRLEPGAHAYCEWRDQSNPYRAGPSLHFQNGAFFAREAKLCDIPTDAWVGVEVKAPLGQSNSRWAIALTLPSGEVREFKDLSCDSNWKELRWVGFCALGGKNAAFYLDDIDMENR